MKKRYKAWSKLRQEWVYVYAHSPRQAEILIRRRVQSKIGRFDEDYKVKIG